MEDVMIRIEGILVPLGFFAAIVAAVWLSGRVNQADWPNRPRPNKSCCPSSSRAENWRSSWRPRAASGSCVSLSPTPTG